MAVPELHVRIDFDRDDSFATAGDDVTAYMMANSVTWTRGRSADFSAEATGTASFTLRNVDDRFTPDRNWHDNPSFEAGTTGWSTAAVAGINVAATSIAQVTDNAGQGGTKAGSAVLTSTQYSGVTFPIPYSFRAGVVYSVSAWLKSVSGNLNIGGGVGVIGDYGGFAGPITTSWAKYSGTWTPGADTSDAVFFIRTTTAAAATVRIDAVQVNPGASANTYIEAPTKGQLVPGRPVHLYATYSAVDYPLFFGYIERLAPNPRAQTVTITCYDVLRQLSERDVVVPANSYIQRSARDFRREVLEDFERGTINLCHNGSAETDVAGWATSGGTVTRNAGDAAPGLGSACVQIDSPVPTARLYFPLRLAPLFFAGQTYRFSAWLKLVSGEAVWTLGAYGGAYSPGGDIVDRTITLTGTWTRYTFTATLPANYTATSPLVFNLISTGVGVALVDGLMVSRGLADPAYTEVVAGRWPNWCGNGSFNGGALNGWYDGWANRCTNGGFETDTTGWAGIGLTRSTAQHLYGVACATWAAGLTLTYDLAGTFKSGVTYDLSAAFLNTTVGTPVMTLSVASIGTPGDVATVTDITVPISTWKTLSVSWTPSADRADARISVTQNAGTPFLDGVQIARRDSALAGQVYPYSETGPGGGGSFVTTRTTSTTAKYGSLSQSIATPATAGAGRVYDFNHYGVYFLAGRAYTASVWINPSSNMPYKVGLGASAGDGTWDEANATGTANTGGWTQVTVTWTPSADRSAFAGLGVVLYVYQTDATARTVLIDGVRVIPGNAADDFEMPHWLIGQEPDVYATSAALSGSALSALTTINGLTLSRHWISPSMTTPWYTYRTDGRAEIAAKASVETFDDDLNDMTSAEIDRASIINIVPITFAGKIEYYVDQASVDIYGPRPGPTIAGSAFFADATVPDIIGSSLIARYKDPRARPVITVVNRFPSQLSRELDDLVTVNFARLEISGDEYLILLLTTTVTLGGRHWRTDFQLEEFG